MESPRWTNLLIFSGVLFQLCNSQLGPIPRTKLCGDEKCEKMLTMAIVMKPVTTDDPKYLTLRAGDKIDVYSKEDEASNNALLWGGKLNGRFGFFPKSAVRETAGTINEAEYVVSTENDPWFEDLYENDSKDEEGEIPAEDEQEQQADDREETETITEEEKEQSTGGSDISEQSVSGEAEPAGSDKTAVHDKDKTAVHDKDKTAVHDKEADAYGDAPFVEEGTTYTMVGNTRIPISDYNAAISPQSSGTATASASMESAQTSTDGASPTSTEMLTPAATPTPSFRDITSTTSVASHLIDTNTASVKNGSEETDRAEHNKPNSVDVALEPSEDQPKPTQTPDMTPTFESSNLFGSADEESGTQKTVFEALKDTFFPSTPTDVDDSSSTTDDERQVPPVADLLEHREDLTRGSNGARILTESSEHDKSDVGPHDVSSEQLGVTDATQGTEESPDADAAQREHSADDISSNDDIVVTASEAAGEEDDTGETESRESEQAGVPENYTVEAESAGSQPDDSAGRRPTEPRDTEAEVKQSEDSEDDRGLSPSSETIPGQLHEIDSIDTVPPKSEATSPDALFSTSPADTSHPETSPAAPPQADSMPSETSDDTDGLLRKLQQSEASGTEPPQSEASVTNPSPTEAAATEPPPAESSSTDTPLEAGRPEDQSATTYDTALDTSTSPEPLYSSAYDAPLGAAKSGYNTKQAGVVVSTKGSGGQPTNETPELYAAVDMAAKRRKSSCEEYDDMVTVPPLTKDRADDYANYRPPNTGKTESAEETYYNVFD